MLESDGSKARLTKRGSVKSDLGKGHTGVVLSRVDRRKMTLASCEVCKSDNIIFVISERWMITYELDEIEARRFNEDGDGNEKDRVKL